MFLVVQVQVFLNYSHLKPTRPSARTLFHPGQNWMFVREVIKLSIIIFIYTTNTMCVCVCTWNFHLSHAAFEVKNRNDDI